jgi:hypothetical protein
MFGTLRPDGCSVSSSELRDYHTFYCGMCKSLGAHFGTVTRILVSHDSVFLAMVVDGLMGEQAGSSRCRCPMLPIIHRPIVEPNSAAMRFATATQILLGDQWLADRSAEGKKVASWVRPLAQPRVERACSMLEELGISVAPLRNFEQRQASSEAIWNCTPEQAAQPTADALGYLFSAITVLPGVQPVQNDALKELLYSLGHALGQSIYWLDALDDLRKDFLSRDFNPCLMNGLSWQTKSWQMSLLISSERVDECCSLLSSSLKKIHDIIDKIPWVRHRDIIFNVLTKQLPLMAEQVAAKATSLASTERKEELLAYRSLAWYSRALRQGALAVLFVWAWFSHSWLAHAGEKKKPNPQADPTSVLSKPHVPSKIKKWKHRHDNDPPTPTTTSTTTTPTPTSTTPTNPPPSKTANPRRTGPNSTSSPKKTPTEPPKEEEIPNGDGGGDSCFGQFVVKICLLGGFECCKSMKL